MPLPGRSRSSRAPPPSGLALYFFTGPRNRQGSFAARINANADDGGVPRHRKRDSDAGGCRPGSITELPPWLTPNLLFLQGGSGGFPPLRGRSPLLVAAFTKEARRIA